MPGQPFAGCTATMIVGRQQNDVYLNQLIVWTPQAGVHPVHGARRLCFLVWAPFVCFVYCQIFLQAPGGGFWISAVGPPPILVAGQMNIPGLFIGPLLVQQPTMRFVPAIQGPPGVMQTLATGYHFFWAHHMIVAANQGTSFYYYPHKRPPRSATTRPRSHIPRGPFARINWRTQEQNYRWFA